MRECTSAATRDPLDFYRTPDAAVLAILPYLPVSGTILEPASGDGAIVRVLRSVGIPHERIYAVEIEPERACVSSAYCRTDVADFLQWSAPRRFDLIIANPPYREAQKFIEKAVDVGSTVAMLLRLGFLESKKRYPFHHKHPSDVFVFSRRPRFTGRKQSYPAAFAWFVWGPGRGNNWSLL